MEQVIPADVSLGQVHWQRFEAAVSFVLLCSVPLNSALPRLTLLGLQLQAIPAAGGAGAAGGAQRPWRRAAVQPVARLVRLPASNGRAGSSEELSSQGICAVLLVGHSGTAGSIAHCARCL